MIMLQKMTIEFIVDDLKLYYILYHNKMRRERERSALLIEFSHLKPLMVTD